MAERRTMLAKIAMGAAAKKSTHLCQVLWFESIAKIALRAKRVVSERRPEQASTTSRLVQAR